MRVLLLVDIQNDFMPGGTLAVPEGDSVVDGANRLLESGRYNLKIATQDWHPRDHSSFASNNPGAKVFEVIDLNGQPQCMWPDHCVAGSRGAELHSGLRRDLIDHVVLKGLDKEVDSYSGFYDNDRRSPTGLHDYILDRAASLGRLSAGEVELHICGLALDYCVLFTALDAANLGYKTEVVIDVCRAVNLRPGDDLQAMSTLEQGGVTLSRALNLLLPGGVAPNRRELEIRA